MLDKIAYMSIDKKISKASVEIRAAAKQAYILGNEKLGDALTKASQAIGDCFLKLDEED